MDITPLYKIASTVTNPITAIAIAIVTGAAFALAKRPAPKLAWAFLIVSVVVLGGSFAVITGIPGKYQIRVRVEDREGRLMYLTSGVALTGAPNEKAPREGNSEWLFTVFPQDLPPDKKVVLSAEMPEQSLVAREEVVLADRSTSVTLHLKERPLGDVAGTVLDRSTNKALGGSTVYVVGYSQEVVTTDATGGFQLKAHKPPEQPVVLHTEHAGFEPDHTSYTSGRTDLTIGLQPLRSEHRAQRR